MPDINIGQLSEVINNKMDRDGHNIANTSAVIIETYSNGTTWYRIWSDGWCEQGGKYYNNNTAISFLKPFKNTIYSVMTQCTDVSPNDGIYQSCWTNKTTTGFTGWITYGNNLASDIETDWYAFGYIL